MEGTEAVAVAAVAVPDIAGVQVMVEGEYTLLFLCLPYSLTIVITY